MPFDLSQLQTLLPAAIGPQLTTLLALIVLQVLLAVAVAIRDKVFDWRMLADFYRSRVMPMLVGWFAFVVFTKFAVAEVLGPEYGGLAGDGVAWAAWLAVVASLGGKIIENVKALYGANTPIPAPPANGNEQ